MVNKTCIYAKKGVHWPELGHLLGPHHKFDKTASIIIAKAYGKAYHLQMGIPKVTKQTELRDNLYKTLEEIATGGSARIVPTKKGEVVILSRQEYDDILFEKELLQEFQESVKFEELIEARSVVDRLDKKFGFKK